MTLQRMQLDSSLNWVPESAPGVMGATGVVVPLAAESGYSITQEPVAMPIGMADRLPDSFVPGLIMAGGALPLGLDYEFVGNPLRSLWLGYSQIDMGSAGSLHEFFEDLTAGTRQKTATLESKFAEATAQYICGHNNIVSGIDFRGDFQGGAQLTAQILGVGDVDEVVSGATMTNHGFQPTNYFDGRIRYKVSGTEHDVAGFSELSCSAARPAAREEGGFLSGEATGIGFGPIGMKGSLGVPFKVGGTGPFGDLNFYSDAINRRVVSLDYMVADAPLTTCTKYLRWQIFCALVFRSNPKPGPGNGFHKYAQRFETARMASTNMVMPAEYHQPLETALRGPYLVPASAKLGVKLNGGATIPITITAGAARTVDQIVADINGNGTFAASATADNFLGVIRMRTTTGGSTTSIQVDTAQVDSCHALLGLNGTTRSGRSSIACRMTLYNLLTADY